MRLIADNCLRMFTFPAGFPAALGIERQLKPFPIQCMLRGDRINESGNRCQDGSAGEALNTGTKNGWALAAPGHGNSAGTVGFQFGNLSAGDVIVKRLSGLIGFWAVVALVPILLPGQALAAEGLSGANTAWILTSTALVLFMTLPGLALFYAGLVQSKNVLSVMMHCFAIACLMSVLWLAVAYSLAFGDGGGANAVVGGLERAFLAVVGQDTL